MIVLCYEFLTFTGSVTFICNIFPICREINKPKNLCSYNYSGQNILCLLTNSTEGANAAVTHSNEWLRIAACSDSGYTEGPSIQGRKVW
jgi:hypothetical protein